MKPIYLDCNATTPVAEPVLDAMLPYFREMFWNAASTHIGGGAAIRAVEAAREQAAVLLGARTREIHFTSGATESNNLALKGLVNEGHARTTVLVSAIEHKAVLDTALALRQRGMRVETIPVCSSGLIDLEALDELLTDDVLVVSVMLANNEMGAIQPVREVAELAHARGALVHTDATQGVGKIPVTVDELNVDLLSFSAHKMYGPKGVGALYARRGVHLEPQLHGGGHERGIRSGTMNVPGVVGLGAAADLAQDLVAEGKRHEALVKQLVQDLIANVRGVELIAEEAPRLPNTACLRFRGADAEAVMSNAPTVMVSSGSACSARVPEPSHVLLAMGLTREEAHECIRISVGRDTTAQDIHAATNAIRAAVERVRALESVSPAAC